MPTRCMAAAIIILPNPATRVWAGPCGRRSRSIRLRPARCPPPRGRSAVRASLRERSGKPVEVTPVEVTMAVYTVHEPPSKAGVKSGSEPERFVFVRDGFSFAALLFGPLWMLRHRMWLALLGYAVVTAALALVLRLHASAGAGAVVWALFALLLGFEAGTLRRFTLGRRGLRNIGVVVGDDLELAERRFFDAWVRKDSRGEPAGTPALAPALRMPHPDVLGRVPAPGAS